MSTILGRKYSLDWRGDPPHMLQTDIPVWYRFLEVYGGLFINLWYDVLLGAMAITPEQEKDGLKRMERTLSARRADAFVETKNEIWIIEVSDDPGLRSIGQLISYGVLWTRDPIIPKIEQLVLVGSTVELNLLDAAATIGIRVYVI